MAPLEDDSTQSENGSALAPPFPTNEAAATVRLQFKLPFGALPSLAVCGHPSNATTDNLPYPDLTDES